MPRTESLRRAEEEVRALCAALRPNGGGGSDGGASVAAAVAIAAREGRVDVASALSSAAEAATAAVGNSGGGGLRAAALEGLCFFAWTHVRPDGGGGGGGGGGRDEDENDAASFLENEAGSIPAQLALECSKLAAAAAVSEPASAAVLRRLGGGDENDNEDDNNHGVGAIVISAAMDVDGGDDSTAAAAATSAVPRAPPPEYEIPALDLLRSADVLENGAGIISGSGPAAAGARALPPLGFPVWSQKWTACRAAHAALLPLLELHSLASQPPLLAALSSRVAASLSLIHI